MLPLQPTPRRTATSPDQQTHAVECCDQREARHLWFRQPRVKPLLCTRLGDSDEREWIP